MKVPVTIMIRRPTRGLRACKPFVHESSSVGDFGGDSKSTAFTQAMTAFSRTERKTIRIQAKVLFEELLSSENVSSSSAGAEYRDSLYYEPA